MYEFYANCPKGLEQLLQKEVIDLGGEFKRETVGGIWFESELATAYRICLWSRIANKVFLQLISAKVTTAEDLYECVSEIAWQDHISPNGKLWVDFQGSNRSIRNSQFGAVKVKDAVVDRLRNQFSVRPDVDKQSPNLIINARLAKGKLSLLLDLCGESLHRRGYRLDQGAAPLKENLAAGILYRSNWPNIAAQGGCLLDPMCGSGTFLIEAAMIAADMAPGLKRPVFAFEHWLNHENDHWLALREEARARIDLDKIPEIRGYDSDKRVLDAAQNNIERAGFYNKVRVLPKPLQEFKKPTHAELTPGLIITNPPYGERLGELEQLAGLYADLGNRLKTEFMGWQAGVFTGNPDAGKFMGLRSHKKYKLFNGTIPAELLMFDINEQSVVNAPPPIETLTSPRDPYKITEGAKMVINRLQKNLKHLGKWRDKQNVTCYRLYDADMPEYSAAIDVYGDYVHVQEYQAPKSIDEEKAQARLNDIIAAVKQVIQPDLEKTSIKTRRRNKGKSQYERLDSDKSNAITCTEGSATFEINLWDYLDSGLFLDHRPIRQYIYEHAHNKKFLNLFCYTATASVHAALGGAKETVSVDMSKTYLNWAERNFRLNKLVSSKHRFEQADCLEWLTQCREGFDMIFLDPPTFSNSKRIQQVLDVQRDHVSLIKRCMELLNPGGLLIFSNNLRGFKLDAQALEKYTVKDYTQQSLDPDFKRNSKIHHCWLIEQA